VATFKWDCWRKPFDWDCSQALPWDAFHYRDAVQTLADEVAEERRLTRSIARNPFTHLLPCMRDGWSKNWLARPGQDAISH
jgi:hypothetical protein